MLRSVPSLTDEMIQDAMDPEVGKLTDDINKVIYEQALVRIQL